MVIDAHAHVSPTLFGETKEYLEQLEQSDIQQGVIGPGGMLDIRRMSDYLTGKAEPFNQPPPNDYVEQSFHTHSQLHGLACVDPLEPRAVQKLEQYLKNGFRGLKLAPLIHALSFDSEAVAGLVLLCGERGVPVYSHVVPRPGVDTARFAELARRFPHTNFVLEHMGHGPADQEATAAASELDNFFLETSLGTYLHIHESVKKAGAHKVLFGSEYPLSHPAVELKKILLLPISEPERERILGENIRELLRLE
ncbi:amidohydrolase family protein [Cystobacter fuscus]|uniref:amidohydrolase family protein n=1 Tax=Cystobacter fuscus TaxID=43 RepID=UPI002B2BA6E5|nr:amidohydrolase family protein [Cystobacter fuscus]